MESSACPLIEATLYEDEDEDVNVSDLFEVGKATVKQMEGQAIFSYI